MVRWPPPLPVIWPYVEKEVFVVKEGGAERAAITVEVVGHLNGISTGIAGYRKFLSRKNLKREPWNLLVPLLVMTLTTAEGIWRASQ